MLVFVPAKFVTYSCGIFLCSSGEGSIGFNGIFVCLFFDLCFLFLRPQICCVVISFLSVMLLMSNLFRWIKYGHFLPLFFVVVISCFTFIYLVKLYCCLMVKMTFSFSKGFISPENLGQSFSLNCINFSIFIFGLFLLYWLSSLKVSLLLV